MYMYLLNISGNKDNIWINVLLKLSEVSTYYLKETFLKYALSSEDETCSEPTSYLCAMKRIYDFEK